MDANELKEEAQKLAEAGGKIAVHVQSELKRLESELDPEARKIYETAGITAKTVLNGELGKLKDELDKLSKLDI